MYAYPEVLHLVAATCSGPLRLIYFTLYIIGELKLDGEKPSVVVFFEADLSEFDLFV